VGMFWKNSRTQYLFNSQGDWNKYYYFPGYFQGIAPTAKARWPALVPPSR